MNFVTLYKQILFNGTESIQNRPTLVPLGSSPLAPLSDDPSDLKAITSGLYNINDINIKIMIVDVVGNMKDEYAGSF